tara:strand:- start:716 stop:1804 length:1089 start_codon:yes stop_codon:yes gene_type:complete
MAKFSETLDVYLIYIIIGIILLVILILMYKVGEKDLLVKNYKKQFDENDYIINVKNNINDTITFSNNNVEFGKICMLGAYNCCNIKSYNNSQAYVDRIGLNYSFNTGARCLDFQVYLHNNNLIVASSNTYKNYKYKETINYLELLDVFNDIFELINNSSNTFIVLHIRVMSNNSLAYKQIVKMYKNKFENLRLKETNILKYNPPLHQIKFDDLLGRVVLIMKPIDDKYELIFNMNDDYKTYINSLSINYSGDYQERIDNIKKLDINNVINQYVNYDDKFSIIFNNDNESQQLANRNLIYIYIPNVTRVNNKIEFDIKKLTKKNYYNIICIKYQYITKNKSKFIEITNKFKFGGKYNTFIKIE